MFWASFELKFVDEHSAQYKNDWKVQKIVSGEDRKQILSTEVFEFYNSGEVFHEKLIYKYGNLFTR